jgi:hypothetical protein
MARPCRSSAGAVSRERVPGSPRPRRLCWMGRREQQVMRLSPDHPATSPRCTSSPRLTGRLPKRNTPRTVPRDSRAGIPSKALPRNHFWRLIGGGWQPRRRRSGADLTTDSPTSGGHGPDVSRGTRRCPGPRMRVSRAGPEWPRPINARHDAVPPSGGFFSRSGEGFRPALVIPIPSQGHRALTPSQAGRRRARDRGPPRPLRARATLAGYSAPDPGRDRRQTDAPPAERTPARHAQGVNEHHGSCPGG